MFLAGVHSPALTDPASLEEPRCLHQILTFSKINNSADLSALSEKACSRTRRRKACLFLSISLCVLKAPEPESMVRYQSDFWTLALRDP